MSRVLFGSILIPDDADAEYLASIGLSEDDIKEAMADSPHYDANYKIIDPLQGTPVSQVEENQPVPSIAVENSKSGTSHAKVLSHSKAGTFELNDNVDGHTRAWKSIFKPKSRKAAYDEDILLKQEADITEWRTFSLAPHTEDEIREKVLTDYNNVCFSYLCSHQELSEDFIIELAALSTGLLNKDNYSKYIDYLKKAVMISAGIEKGTYDFDMLPAHCGLDPKNVTYRTTDHLDWKAIAKYQILSQAFIDKYYSLLYPGVKSFALYGGLTQISAS